MPGPFLPGSNGTQPCPRCRADVAQSDRYPAYLCAECEALITDVDGVPVRGSNASLTGGFVLWWPGGEHPNLPCSGAWVWISDTRWWATEARFGGTLVLSEAQGPQAR